LSEAAARRAFLHTVPAIGMRLMRNSISRAKVNNRFGLITRSGVQV